MHLRGFALLSAPDQHRARNLSSPIYGKYMYLNALENAFDFPSNLMGPFSLGRSKFYTPTKEGMTPVILAGFEKISSGQFI